MVWDWFVGVFWLLWWDGEWKCEGDWWLDLGWEMGWGGWGLEGLWDGVGWEVLMWFWDGGVGCKRLLRELKVLNVCVVGIVR